MPYGRGGGGYGGAGATGSGDGFGGGRGGSNSGGGGRDEWGNLNIQRDLNMAISPIVKTPPHIRSLKAMTKGKTPEDMEQGFKDYITQSEKRTKGYNYNPQPYEQNRINRVIRDETQQLDRSEYGAVEKVGRYMWDTIKNNAKALTGAALGTVVGGPMGLVTGWNLGKKVQDWGLYSPEEQAGQAIGLMGSVSPLPFGAKVATGLMAKVAPALSGYMPASTSAPVSAPAPSNGLMARDQNTPVPVQAQTPIQTVLAEQGAPITSPQWGYSGYNGYRGYQGYGG